jgi:type IV pilus assembly protein PilM
MLSGGGSLVPNLDRYISQFFNVPVEIMNPFQNVAVDEREIPMDTINRLAPHFTVAVGLALRKVGD